MPSIDRANRTTRDRRHRQRRRRRQHQHQRPHSDDDDDVDAAPAPPPNPSHLSSAPRPLSAPPAALSLCAPSRETPNAARKKLIRGSSSSSSSRRLRRPCDASCTSGGTGPHLPFSLLFPNRRNLRWEETGETQTRAGRGGRPLSWAHKKIAPAGSGRVHVWFPPNVRFVVQTWWLEWWGR